MRIDYTQTKNSPLRSLMVNLPADIGKDIFKQICNTPPPDYEKMRAEADRYERQIAEQIAEQTKNE